MITTFTLGTAIVLATWILIYLIDRKYYIPSLSRRVHTVDGSPLESKIVMYQPKTIFGSTFDLFGLTPRTLFETIRGAYATYKGQNVLLYTLTGPVYNVVRAEQAEEIFQSTKLITKGKLYTLMTPFMGDGLITSTDEKWHFRRKLIAPTFHLNLLQSFLDTFKKESRKLISVLQQNENLELDLRHFISQFTLNTVCETALGIQLDDMSEAEQYASALRSLAEIAVERFCNPLLFFYIPFCIFGNYRKFVTNLKILTDFSNHIIQQRRKQFRNRKIEKHEAEFGQRKRFALLDTLLEAEDEGLIDPQGICSEVTTFITAGYDSTSICLTLTLVLLSLHQDVQQRCFEELQQHSDNDKELSAFDYNNFTYLECVIKESMRLFPPAPFIARTCTENCVLNGLFFPKNTQIFIHIFDMMRDPRHFPNPKEFQPDRFLPENTINRHPFAFNPFSAGLRNCIGQKFAMLEIKVFLVSILRNFKVFPVTRVEDLIFEAGVPLAWQNTIKVKLQRRQAEKEKPI